MTTFLSIILVPPGTLLSYQCLSDRLVTEVRRTNAGLLDRGDELLFCDRQVFLLASNEDS